MSEAHVVFAGPGEPPAGFVDAGAQATVRRIVTLEDADPEGRPAVLLLSGELAATGGLAALPRHVTVIATDVAGRRAADGVDRLFLATDGATAPDARAQAVRAAARLSEALAGRARAEDEASRVTAQVQELNKIGMALMSERDLETLLDRILREARRVTSSDGGSLYLVEPGEDGRDCLHFLRAQNDTLPDLPSPAFTLPLDTTSIAGWVATSGRPLVIDDVYDIDEEAPYAFNPSFDTEHGYRARSMLAVPMTDHRGHVVGVLQVINRLRERAPIRTATDADRYVLTYGPAQVEAVSSLAGQAAVSIENARLYRDIERLFEGFIKAAVTAIDQRDPATSGHSVRVATLTCDLAEAVDRATEGPLREVRFTREQMRELRYAGLLHDFGKVGVREEVLVKAKKLPAILFERLSARFELVHASLEADFHRKRADHLEAHGREGLEAFMQSLGRDRDDTVRRLERYRRTVLDCNEPRLLPEEVAEVLDEIAGATFRTVDGADLPYLTPEERHFLSIRRGSLDADERRQIESHVTHTYNFLREIPWTEDLSQVAEIAYGHHEKLDGTGYPRRIGAADLPVQTRIMTVADIFDALTASDRPYKKALPAARALEILRLEADEAAIDPAIVDMLVASRVYERILEEDWRLL